MAFLEEYFNFLLNYNNENTAYKAMAFVKVIIRQAINQDVIENNPFDNFIIRKRVGKGVYLSKDELQKIYKLFRTTSNMKIKNVARYYLFSCYTGLHYSDIKALKFENIYDGFIELKMHKTKDYAKIALNKKAKELLSKEDVIYVFKVYCNQKTNEYLHQIEGLCKIQKNLTFHSSRHTFATMGISLGIPIELISKILGHHDLKTTQIYSEIIDDVIVKQMNKFDSL